MYNMTPSEQTVTREQAGKISDLLVAALLKSDFPSVDVQHIIETQGRLLTDELLAVIRERVEMMSEVIIRSANVNGSLSAKAAFSTTGREMYLDDRIVDTIPDFAGGETPVTFFKPGEILTNGQLAEEYAGRGLKPAHPSALSKINQDDPVFADDHPNATVWDGASYAIFNRWLDERNVHVRRSDREWDDDWWFAGVPAN